jgi:hypothetical protein
MPLVMKNPFSTPSAAITPPVQPYGPCVPTFALNSGGTRMGAGRCLLFPSACCISPWKLNRPLPLDIPALLLDLVADALDLLD